MISTGLTQHATILAYMFSVVENSKITKPLSATQEGRSNELYIKDFTASLLKAAFPSLTSVSISRILSLTLSISPA